jgi:type I restriction enzyme M protein
MSRQSTPKKAPPQSTAQQLASIIKSCRDIMRKDKGLNGDLDRLPMLTWIMFLKFVDDLEDIRRDEAKLAGKRFRPAMEPPLSLEGLGRKSPRHDGSRANCICKPRRSSPARR